MRKVLFSSGAGSCPIKPSVGQEVVYGGRGRSGTSQGGGTGSVRCKDAAG